MDDMDTVAELDGALVNSETLSEELDAELDAEHGAVSSSRAGVSPSVNQTGTRDSNDNSRAIPEGYTHPYTSSRSTTEGAKGSARRSFATGIPPLPEEDNVFDDHGTTQPANAMQFSAPPVPRHSHRRSYKVSETSAGTTSNSSNHKATPKRNHSRKISDSSEQSDLVCIFFFQTTHY